jgi:RNA polymerase sigma-70 factor (ECF subfamily)
LPDLNETILQCQRGNALAWEALIKAYQRRVFAAAYYYLRKREESQDATQEVFLKVYRTLESFRGEEDSFLPWLMAVVRNCCIDRLRKDKTRMRHEEEMKTPGADSVDERAGPEEEIGAQQRKGEIYRALDGFSQINREILLLKDIQGMNNEDVAEILSLPVGTVKSRSSRARIRLAKILAGHPDAAPDESEAV